MNKDDERRVLERFLTARGLSTAGIVPRERPDFLIGDEAHLIGVEVTSLVEARSRQATVPQQWVSEAHRLLGAVRTQFESSNHAPVVVQMEFQPSYDATKFRDPSLPLQLANVVDQQVGGDPLAPGRLRREPHPALASLYAAPLSGGSSAWRLGGDNAVYPATCDDVRRTVGAKEPFVAVYRKAAPEVWLLIDCDLPGQGISLTAPEDHCVVATSFDAVYCIDFDSNWVSIGRESGRPTTR